ncbi:MAG: S-methyl-5'-thioinosine phosphorylase [Thermomicrobiales bacterium]
MPHRIGIIGGSGVERPEAGFTERVIETPYGPALAWIGADEHADVVFLSRHGVEHGLPPHRINYRANVKALQTLGVDRVIASFAVGGITEDIPPGGVVALDQIIDFTSGRDFTFFDGGAAGLRHTPFTEPFSPRLREAIVARGTVHGLTIRPNGTYICTNGPRFETAAEIRMAKLMGADVVGMTAMPEAILARELEIHYAGIAVSVNWAAGIRGPLQVDFGALESIRGKLLPLLLDVLRTTDLDASIWSQESGD